MKQSKAKPDKCGHPDCNCMKQIKDELLIIFAALVTLLGLVITFLIIYFVNGYRAF